MSSDALALLDLWATARNLASPERAVVVAASVDPPIEAAHLADRPLGERDLRLAAFHRRHSGPNFEATTICPDCNENVDLSVPVEVLTTSHREQPDTYEPITVHDTRVEWRPVSTNDLLAAAALDDEHGAADIIVSRCSQPGASTEIRAAVAEAIAEADPLAEVLLNTSCPECDSPFVAEIDIAAQALATLEHTAAGLLADIDVLAQRYGWTETEILAIPAHRRERYLALAEAR